MLEILQAKDYKNYYGLFDKLGISDEIVSVVEAMDKDNVIGFGIYHFAEKSVAIDYVESNGDLYLYDGIVRSILFLALTNNIDSAVFNMQDKTEAIRLGLIAENDNTLTSIDYFMNNCKNCKKV